MITPTTASASTPSSTGASSALSGARSTLDRDQFLQLLVTQLRNQDPMSPLQPHEFAAQLAQFSSVEQLTQLNDAMSIQLQLGQTLAMLDRTNLSASLMGRTIVADGNQVAITGTGDTIHVDIGALGGNAKLTLKDDSGNVVATRDLGALSGGKQTVSLPDGLPPGSYHYELEVKDATGTAVAVTTYTVGTVTGVVFKDSDILLQLGSMQVSLGALSEIGPGSQAQPAPSPGGTLPVQWPRHVPIGAQPRFPITPLLQGGIPR